MRESDVTFPSGPWTGFYTYDVLPGKHRTDLILEFVNGRITGEGNDSVGAFVISGQYDTQTKECYWTKTYVGSHDVFYRGFRELKGIWGTWEIAASARGGFHIWPVAEGTAAGCAEEAEETVPAMAGADELGPLRLHRSAFSKA
jgi:hypothetical protein